MQRTYIFSIVLFSLLFSCAQEKEEKTFVPTKYFDLTEYFNKEAARLQQLNPEVRKTVNINGSKEFKKLRIKDWQQELSIFADADINKTAWIGKFQIIPSDHSIIYRSEDPKISVKEIELKKSGALIEEVRVIRQNKNFVYESTDTLIYSPSAYYSISKYQKIKLLAGKSYQITSKF